MPDDPTPSPLDAIDLALLTQLASGNDWLRSVLCTLARQGLKAHKSRPDACDAILDSLVTLPWYKAGQFLFDLLEWEDFMLDGPPPPLRPTSLNPAALANLTKALRAVRASLDGDGESTGVEFATTASTPFDDDLPPLASSQYLFQYVALGVWQALRASAPVPGTS